MTILDTVLLNRARFIARNATWIMDILNDWDSSKKVSC